MNTPADRRKEASTLSRLMWDAEGRIMPSLKLLNCGELLKKDNPQPRIKNYNKVRKRDNKYAKRNFCKKHSI